MIRIWGDLISSGGSSRPAGQRGRFGLHRVRHSRQGVPRQAGEGRATASQARGRAHSSTLRRARHPAGCDGCTMKQELHDQLRASATRGEAGRTGDVVVDGLLHGLALLQGLDLQQTSEDAAAVRAKKLAASEAGSRPAASMPGQKAAGLRAALLHAAPGSLGCHSSRANCMLLLLATMLLAARC